MGRLYSDAATEAITVKKLNNSFGMKRLLAENV
jgi:hypothetical protein